MRTAEDSSEDPSGLPDVTVTLTGPGGCQATTTTHATGHYVFRTLGSGTYTVTPVKEGCTFTPPAGQSRWRRQTRGRIFAGRVQRMRRVNENEKSIGIETKTRMVSRGVPRDTSRVLLSPAD